jgi:cysteine-rich repeat protein
MLVRSVPAWLVLIIAGSSCARAVTAAGGTGGESGAGGARADAGRPPDAITHPPPPGTGGCSGTVSTTGGCNQCGNGTLETPGESCDDGNQQGGDGCSANCQTETDWICPEPGKPCVFTVKCGDGVVAGAETCDDRNLKSGDGCSADCRVEPGWTCPAVGARCLPVCGDGMVLGSETCDDANTTSGDGCSEV